MIDILMQELSEKDKVISYLNFDREKKIRRLTYFDEKNYGSGINLYFMSKKSFTSPAEALCAAWMKQYLWEEDLEDTFSFNREDCENVYEEAFCEEIEKYTFEEMSEASAKKYINDSVAPIIEATKKAQSKCAHPEKVSFLEKSGTYVNKEYVTKNAFILHSDEEYIDGSVLFKNKTETGRIYREMFFETDRKFVLFLS